MPKTKPEPKLIHTDDLAPHYQWNRAIPAPGHTNVDFETRVEIGRAHV